MAKRLVIMVKKRVNDGKLRRIRWWKSRETEVKEKFLKSVIVELAEREKITSENLDVWWKKIADMV